MTVNEMNINFLKELLERENVPKSGYSLEEDELVLSDAVLCLRKDGYRWKVFIEERGQEYDVMRFITEGDAVLYFLERKAKGYPLLKGLQNTVTQIIIETQCAKKKTTVTSDVEISAIM